MKVGLSPLCLVVVSILWWKLTGKCSLQQWALLLCRRASGLWLS